MATSNDGMVRKVGWLLVSQREKVFSCATARSVGGGGGASEDCRACLVTSDQDDDGDGSSGGGDDAGGACRGQWVVQVRIAEHVLSLCTRGVRMMVVIRGVNRKHPKIRYGRKASPT